MGSRTGAAPPSAGIVTALPSAATTLLEHIRIFRFLIRAAAFLLIVAWTLLIVGAAQALLETGSILRSLELKLGDAELEAAIYNLLLLMERAGLPGLAVAWLVGVVIVLAMRRLLLGLVGLVWRTTSTWSRPKTTASPRVPAPAEAPRPAPTRLPADAGPRAGPWTSPARPPAASVPPVPSSPSGRKRTSAMPASPSVVDRADRTDRPSGQAGTVVVRRPRGHMDRP